MSLCYHPHCPINGKSKTCSQKVHNLKFWVSNEPGTHFCKSEGIKSRDCFANNGEAVSANYDPRFGSYQLTVTDDGKALVKFPDNARVGYYYDAYVGDNGELLVVDGNNTVFSAAMNDNGTLSDYDAATWFDID